MSLSSRERRRQESLTPSQKAAWSRRQFLAGLSAAAGCHLLAPHVRAAIAEAKPIFSDVTAESGVTWRQFNGLSPDRFLIETMGGGVGFFDCDNDGWQDLFLLNGGETPHGKSEQPLRNALYHNLGNGKFVDVAAEAGLSELKTYGMGVCIADFDNDGHQDIFVTGFPQCTLYHNNGNGTFSDVTRDAGLLNAGRWATGAAWFDYDRDGYLDLVVCNYVQFSFDGPAPKCEYGNLRTYCEQRAYTGMPLALYHNNRNGTFTDASQASGLDRFVGRALGVVAVDIDNDGWVDLFVTRDASPNLLLLNKHDGTFADRGLDAEVAFDRDGNAKAGMGVDAADLNADGRPDLVVTNFNYEFDSLFLNRGSFPFAAGTQASHLALVSRPYVGWGIHSLDFDNDGALDLMIVNGHVIEMIESLQPKVSYRERPLLLRNSGDAVFEDVSARAGPAFSRQYLARGVAIADWNNDGFEDAIFTCIGDHPVLLRNNALAANSWLGIGLTGTQSPRDPIGARATIVSGDRKLVRWLTGGTSYLSSHDKRLVFGLGKQAAGSKVDVQIDWPSGARQIAKSLTINSYHQITESSSGSAAEGAAPDPAQSDRAPTPKR